MDKASKKLSVKLAVKAVKEAEKARIKAIKENEKELAKAEKLAKKKADKLASENQGNLMDMILGNTQVSA